MLVVNKLFLEDLLSWKIRATLNKYWGLARSLGSHSTNSMEPGRPCHGLGPCFMDWHKSVKLGLLR